MAICAASTACQGLSSPGASFGTCFPALSAPPGSTGSAIRRGRSDGSASRSTPGGPSSARRLRPSRPPRPAPAAAVPWWWCGGFVRRESPGTIPGLVQPEGAVKDSASLRLCCDLCCWAAAAQRLDESSICLRFRERGKVREGLDSRPPRIRLGSPSEVDKPQRGAGSDRSNEKVVASTPSQQRKHFALCKGMAGLDLAI